MKKTLLVFTIIFTMLSAFLMRIEKPSMTLASDDDEVIEWNSYNDRLPL